LANDKAGKNALSFIKTNVSKALQQDKLAALDTVDTIGINLSLGDDMNDCFFLETPHTCRATTFMMVSWPP